MGVESDKIFCSECGMIDVSDVIQVGQPTCQECGSRVNLDGNR